MEKDEVDLMDYFKVIWKRKIMIVTIVIISAITSAIVSILLPKIYEASAIVRVGEFNIIGQQRYPTEYADGYRVSTPIECVKETVKIFESKFMKDMAREKLKITRKNLKDKNIIIDSIEDTNLIEIKVRAKSPKLTKEIVDTLITIFLERHKEKILQKKKWFETTKQDFKDKLIMEIIPSEIVAPTVTSENPVSPKIALNIIIISMLSLPVSMVLAFVLECSKESKSSVTKK